MSSDSDDQGEPPKPKNVDLADLGAEGGLDGMAEATRLPEGTKRALADAMKRYADQTQDLRDRMKSLQDSAGAHSSLGKIAEQISKQQDALGLFRSSPSGSLGLNSITPPISEPPRIDPALLRPPPNPTYETNKHLQRIEARFDQIQEIAADGAQIATGLQAAAAEFLQKFETAAQSNDRAANKAIWIGAIAVIIAVAMPAAQIIYSEVRRTPDSSAEVLSSLAAVQQELEALRTAQTAASDQLSAAISASSAPTVEVLQDILETLQPLPPEPEAQPLPASE